MTSGGMLSSCTDYGAGFTTSVVMQICSTQMGTYSADVCPSANRVGRCEITETRGGMSGGDQVSFYPPSTMADVMTSCAMENGVNGVTTTYVPN
jgi:hypothetical protein